MKNIRLWGKLSLIAAVLTFAVGGSTARASSVQLTFGAPGFVWFHQGNPATPNHIWVAGDYWQQDFTGTALSSATSESINLNIDDNILSGESLDLNSVINGSVVGSFVIGPGVTGLFTDTFNFAAISGPDYLIQLIATNTIDPGFGSVSISDDGKSFVTLSSVPEPGTLTLLALGSMSLLGFARTRLRAGKQV
jgi:hypothetical protein